MKRIHLRARLVEPSTYAGIAALLLVVRPMIPLHWQDVVSAAATLAGSLAVAFREKGAQ